MNNRRLSDIEIEIMRYAAGGMTGNKTYHQVRDQFMPMDSESMGYANGGGVGSMMQPKKKKKKSNEPVVQGGVDNYLGKQPQVQAPRKWQSSPDKPATELAYITKAEKDLIIKKNIHGGLEGGPNMGPSGIMSLDSFGDIGGAGASGGDTDAGGGYDTGPGGGGFTGRNTNTTTEREFDRQKANQRAALQIAERAQANRLGYNERENITNIDRSNPNYNKSGIFSGGFNPLSIALGLVNPFLGLASRGIMGLKNKFNDITDNPNDLSLRERLTGYKTQADYEKARADRQVTNRRDKLQAAKDKGYNTLFGMKTTDFTPFQEKTLANLNTQTGVKNNLIGGNSTSTRFDGFKPRVGITSTMPEVNITGAIKGGMNSNDFSTGDPSQYGLNSNAINEFGNQLGGMAPNDYEIGNPGGMVQPNDFLTGDPSQYGLNSNSINEFGQSPQFNTSLINEFGDNRNINMDEFATQNNIDNRLMQEYLTDQASFQQPITASQIDEFGDNRDINMNEFAGNDIQMQNYLNDQANYNADPFGNPNRDPRVVSEEYGLVGNEPLPGNDTFAFAPGSIKDRQLKQAYGIYEATGMEPPNLKSLMQEDLESGGQLSLDKNAYSLIG